MYQKHMVKVLSTMGGGGMSISIITKGSDEMCAWKFECYLENQLHCYVVRDGWNMFI